MTKWNQILRRVIFLSLEEICDQSKKFKVRSLKNRSEIRSLKNTENNTKNK